MRRGKGLIDGVIAVQQDGMLPPTPFCSSAHLFVRITHKGMERRRERQVKELHRRYLNSRSFL